MNRPATTSARPGMVAPVPFDKLSAAEQLSELFYLSAVEVTKAAFMAINRAYPLEERESNTKVAYRFAEAHKQAKQHLNFHKKNARDLVDTFCLVKKHEKPYDVLTLEDKPTQDLRKIFAMQLLTLHRRLTDYAPLLVPLEEIPEYLAVLNARYEVEKQTLADKISVYEIDVKLKDYIGD